MATQVKEGSVPAGTKIIPTVKEPPLVGSLFIHRDDRLSLYQRVMRECGDIGLVHFGPFRVLMIYAPELVHTLLIEHANDLDKGDILRRAFQPIVGNGLFVSDGELHRRQRKIMAPSFQPRHIISYADAMTAYGEQIQSGWRDGQVIDVGHEMTQLTMSIVGKVLFDADMFSEADELGDAMTVVLEQTNYSLSRLFPIPLNWPTSRNARVKRALAVLDERVNRMISERKASTEERNDFLSILLRTQGEDGSQMSEKQVRDEALTLFGAGHETTATALTWAWYLLGEHPEAYRKVQQEVDSVLEGRPPTYADLARLPYTLQVFKESLRLYPPAYAFSRATLRDFDLGGYPIQKGDGLVVGIYAIHRRPDLFPEPEKFLPERFTPENEKKLPRYAFLPFGAGHRICIGNHFAMMEGHLLLAALAQRVTLELVPGQHIVPDPSETITIRPGNPLKMTVRRR